MKDFHAVGRKSIIDIAFTLTDLIIIVTVNNIAPNYLCSKIQINMAKNGHVNVNVILTCLQRSEKSIVLSNIYIKASSIFDCGMKSH